LEFIIRQNHAWVKKWTNREGNDCKKTFSTWKYGFDDALQLAIKHRSLVERQLLHYIVVLYPEHAQRIINQMFAKMMMLLLTMMMMMMKTQPTTTNKVI